MDHWSGRSCLAHQATFNEKPDLVGCGAYVCGVALVGIACLAFIAQSVGENPALRMRSGSRAQPSALERSHIGYDKATLQRQQPGPVRARVNRDTLRQIGSVRANHPVPEG